MQVVDDTRSVSTADTVAALEIVDADSGRLLPIEKPTKSVLGGPSSTSGSR